MNKKNKVKSIMKTGLFFGSRMGEVKFFVDLVLKYSGNGLGANGRELLKMQRNNSS